MDYERYDVLGFSSDLLEFNFTSSGPNGNVTIVVQFSETDFPTVYNLAFGRLLPNGDTDDLVRNNNNDRNKILATVVHAVYEFTSRYRGKAVFFSGSTPGRTRLYRMAISINWAILTCDFEIFGVQVGAGNFTYRTF